MTPALTAMKHHVRALGGAALSVGALPASEQAGFVFAITASEAELSTALGFDRVTAASAEDQQRAAKLAQNHGFLKGLMTRVGKHFQAAGAGAWRILSSGGFWVSLLSVCVSAIAFLFEARGMRHFKKQPRLGKFRVAGVGASFLTFIMSFISLFRKIGMAWRQESEDDVEKRKAAALLSRLDDAERAALMAKAQPAHASTGAPNMSTPALHALASVLTAEGAIVESHVAEAVSMDDLVARAKAVVTKAARGGAKAVEKAAKSALALASRNKKNIFYALLVAAFYVYAFAPFFVGRPKRASTVDGVGGVWAKDPATLKRAKTIFDEIAKRKADVSPAIYTEIRKAGNIVSKGLAVV